MTSRLDRTDQYPIIRTTDPYEPVPLSLRNGGQLLLPAYFFRAVTPVVFASDGVLCTSMLGRAPSIGPNVKATATAFSVYPHVYLTCAHILPYGPDGLPDCRGFGVLCGVKPDRAVVVPFSRAVVDREADVAAVVVDEAARPEGYPAPPSLHVARDECDVRAGLLLTLGFPGPSNGERRIALDPAAFVSEETSAQRFEGMIESDGELLDGRLYYRVEMMGLKGGSGAPLVLFDESKDGVRVSGGRVVGIQSKAPKLDRAPDPSFACSYFSDIANALHLKLPEPFHMELGELLERATQPIGKQLIPWIDELGREELTKRAKHDRRVRRRRRD